MEISAGTVGIKRPDGTMTGWLARPQGDGSHAAIIVVMEAFGLNPHIKDVTERLAKQGYVVLAPDVYYRETNGVAGYDQLPDALRLMSSLYDAKVLDDMAAAVAFLQAQPSVRPDRIGMTGFCMGGRITFLTASTNPAIKAAAPFYGGGISTVMQGDEHTPKPPLAYADSLQAPMILFFGENDPFIPLDHVAAIKNRLADLGKEAETIVYPEAPHGFFCEERDSYRPEAAADAWQRLLTFFAKHLNH